MEKYKIVFLIRDNNKWINLFGNIENICKQSHKIEKISVVITDTAVMSCLLGAKINWFNKEIKSALDKKVEFFVCINTMHKYNIDLNSILPAFSLATEGGII